MYDKIILPIDMNEEASWQRALPTALALCQTFNASLYIVTVLPDYHLSMISSYFPSDFNEKAHNALSEAQQKFVEEHISQDVKVQCIITDGSPYEGIIKTAKSLKADLIVMASHNRRKLADYLLGPNAEHVMRHAGTSVMIVR